VETVTGKGSPSVQPNVTPPGVATELAEQIDKSGAAEYIATSSELGRRFQETRSGWLVLGAVWAASVVYLGWHLRQGWVPLDAGALAQMAERVLHGQLPHRDFIEEYTGGLTYLNALAFRLFGVNLLSLRIPLFLFFLGWVPSVYFVARRFARPLAAGAVTLLAVAWSVPNYPEAMPSWYNLFFATWGMLALLRYTETKHKRWLGIAGLCGGLSFLFKVSGLYFVAAGLLFLVFHEASSEEAAPGYPRRGALLYRLLVTTGLLLYLGSLVMLVSTRPTATELVYFVLPSACLVSVLLWETHRRLSAESAVRLRRLFPMGISFLGGALIPVAIFVLWYASQGAAGAWWAGTFVRPTIRMHWDGWEAFSPAASLIGLLPALLILATAYYPRASARRLVRIGAPLVLAGLLLAAWKSLAGYIFVGYAVPLVVPLLALAGPFCLRHSTGIGNRVREQAFLAVATAVACSLVQFPTAGSIYFCYVAPLVILGTLALISIKPPTDHLVLGSLLAFYLIFALWLRPPGYFNVMPFVPGQPVELCRLNLARAGGLRVAVSQAREYEELVRAVRAHAHGSYIYCTPDCPAVYFLSGKLNPTPNINEFLAPDFFDLPMRTERVLESVEDHGVSVIVFNAGPHVESGPIPGVLRTALDARFPMHETVGDFEVRRKLQGEAAPAMAQQSGDPSPLAPRIHAP
jgi:hypothetical protein